jgi:hypothetical protein
MKPIDITGTVRDTFSIGISKNKSEFGVFYGSLFFRNFEDNSWKKIASLQDIESSTKDFSWSSDSLYSVNSLVENGGVFYKCIEEHVSSTIFSTDLNLATPVWQEIGFYGNLRTINIETRTGQDYFYNLSPFDDTVIIYGNNTNLTSLVFKVKLPPKSKIGLNKIFKIQNASYNQVEIYYHDDTLFSNSAFGDYVINAQLINKSSNDNDRGQWSSNFSDSRPISKVNEWKTTETYRMNDIVKVGYFLYTCISNHISNSNAINGFNIDYEANRWIYSGGAYPGGTHTVSDRMPVNLRATGNREIYQLDMLNIPYQGNAPLSVLDLKNRRVVSNSATTYIRNNSYTYNALLTNLINDSNYKNRSTNYILRYIFQNYKPYQETAYTSCIKLENGIPGKKYIFLIKSDGGPYLFDKNIIFNSYGNYSPLALTGTLTDTINWLGTFTDANTNKILSDGLTLNDEQYPVDPLDSGISKSEYNASIFPIQSDPGKIDTFEFTCLDYSDQTLRPGSADTFIGRYLGSYSMGEIFPLRLTPSQPIIGGPGQGDNNDVDLYIQPSIASVLLNSEQELLLTVGDTLDNLTIIATLIKGTDDLAGLRFSYSNSILADLVPDPEGGEETFNTINPFSLSSPGTIKIKTRITDGKVYVLKESDLIFVHRIYWGFNANPEINNEEILDLQHNGNRKQLHGESFIFGTNPEYEVNEYIYFCYPAIYNDISNIEDIISGFSYVLESFETTTINLTNEFGITTLYKIYRSKIKTYGGNFTWLINLT